MITITRDALSFTFPEIARQVRLIVERRIQQIASELPPVWDRAGLIADIAASPLFGQLSQDKQESVRAKLQTWTPAHVEGALRKAVIQRGGLDTDSFTELTVKFQRTMRIPENGTYPLPTGLDQLPLRSVADFPQTAPPAWMKKGSVIMPLHRSEALWLWFSSRCRFAVKIAVGKTDALTGEPSSGDLQRQPQNYLVAPGPPWGDNDEVLRHYVAMPLNTDYSAEESTAGKLNDAGIQFQVVPMRAESYYRDEGEFFLPPTIKEFFSRVFLAPVIVAQLRESERQHEAFEIERTSESLMASAFNTTARQEILEDPYEFATWDQTQTIYGLVCPCNSLVWRQITGTNPPYPSLTVEDYEQAGIPWFDNYHTTDLS